MNKKIFTSITALAALSLTTIHALNKIQYAISNKNSLTVNSDCKIYEWRFGKINYIHKGKGAPLLLVHDLFIGSSIYEFHSIINELSEKYEIFAIDLLGYGLSDKFNMTYTDYLYVQLLNDFIKNVIGRKTNILATGDSASTVIMTCHNNPDIINNIVLINPQSINIMNQPPSRKNRCQKFLLDVPVIGTFIYNTLSTKDKMQDMLIEMISDSSKMSPEIISAYTGFAHYPDYRSKYSYSSFISNFMNTNIVHAIKEINHNIYIIYGEHEEKIEEIIEQYTTYNPAIESVGIKKCKHLPHIENPTGFIKLLDVLMLID